ncbi:MAG: hypothetical protein RIT27_222 [Pseudomonadota bacterium]|jgi:amino-acid N-acetyltransferase
MTDRFHNPAEWEQFVAWFRHASPYIHAHRGKTFVVSFEGMAMDDNTHFRRLMHDIALLHSIGIRLVLVHGARLQIERNLQERGVPMQYAEGMRITDLVALQQVKAACGQMVADITAALSMGLSDSPHNHSPLRLIGGNFISARPLGVREGVDFQYTGEVRRVDYQAISQQLDNGFVVLISPLGYSPTGEVFNLSVEDVATSVAISLKAQKWVSLSETPITYHHNGYLTAQEAAHLLQENQDHTCFRQLRNIVRACQNGVERVHLIERNTDGGILLELFTREGIGTMVSKDPFENLRHATIDDVRGIIDLISPLEEQGILVKRSREKLETEIGQFVVQERDGAIVGCAALYPYPDEKMGELACLAIHQHYKGGQRGDALLAFVEHSARHKGLDKLFVLTTRTAHWFLERGFAPADLDILPMTKRQLYNYHRQSKVFIKPLAID